MRTMPWARRRSGPGQDGKYHSHAARYEMVNGVGRLHAACWPQELAERCRICQQRPLERHLWYHSRTEAQTAYRLDHLLAGKHIAYWRRAARVILLPGKRGDRIDYTPDFEVGELQDDGSVREVVWEVKGASCTCRACKPLKPGQRRKPQLIADDALLKIRMFRAQDPRQLRVLDAKGRPIHV